MLRLKQLGGPVGWETAIMGMRNSWNSWDKSDSEFYGNGTWVIGENDLELMKKLIKAGPSHRKFLRLIQAYVNITAPLYWWKQFDTYTAGGVTKLSCSTMHTIEKKEFDFDDFSCDRLGETELKVLRATIEVLNENRLKYLETKDQVYFMRMVQLLPDSYNQTRTVMLNYENLLNMCNQREGHKLYEWNQFIAFAKYLPYAETFILASRK